MAHGPFLCIEHTSAQLLVFGMFLVMVSIHAKFSVVTECRSPLINTHIYTHILSYRFSFTLPGFVAVTYICGTTLLFPFVTPNTQHRILVTFSYTYRFLKHLHKRVAIQQNRKTLTCITY